MIYSRVNLLKKSERRYQGAVSQRFLFSSIVSAPVLLVILVGVVLFVQYNGLKSNLESAREELNILNPQLALYVKEDGGLVANRKLLDLVDEWKKTQGSFSTLMKDVQGTVPETIQFTRISLHNELKSAVYTDVTEIKPSYNLVVEGLSQGDRAVNEVTRLRKDLMGCTQVAAIFDSIKLASMRKRGGTDDVDQREFRLEGAALEGGKR